MFTSKTCKTCGNPFAPRSGHQKFCSPPCRPYTPAATVPGVLPACPTCGKQFKRATRAQRYCSPRCRPSLAAGYDNRKYAERLGRPLKPQGGGPDLAKRARVAELRAAGMTLKQIAEETGVVESSVSRMLKAIRQAGAAKGERPAAGEG